MDLRTFIRETLCQIANGMTDAQAELRDKGVKINPPHYIDKSGGIRDASPDSACYQTIDFDIALTAVEDQKSGGAMGIAVMGAKIGGGKEMLQSTSAVSRIQFRIVAHLPQSKSDMRPVLSHRLDDNTKV